MYLIFAAAGIIVAINGPLSKEDCLLRVEIQNFDVQYLMKSNPGVKFFGTRDPEKVVLQCVDEKPQLHDKVNW
jgi:hypothetical protein